ncbi:hypothetical protein LV83_01990 [Algoriphagus yeomjeoni]|uniref:Uncharacterized protein n=1 Tax=Algoriphagus yeomjeoni TaxID=291403 RepID=A0A327PCM1_9BACT|nr:hypothetical protein LV83_01990 [Algoriphagus yeomjeoni]
MPSIMKTFSKKNITTILFISLLTISMYFTYQIVKLHTSLSLYHSIIFIIPIPLMHYFYLKDHDKMNHFIGRIIQDLMLALIIFILLYIFLKLNGLFHKIGSTSNLITAIMIWVFISEIAFSLPYTFYSFLKKK